MSILDRFNNGVDRATAIVAVGEEHGFGSAIVNIDIERIEPNLGQFRKHFDGLEELAGSIMEKGVRIPIKVSRRGHKYRIVYGERRWRAAKLAGLKMMPCIITSSTDENTDETSLIENLTRDNLHIVDEACAIREFDCRGYKGEGIAKMIGKSTTYVHRCLKIGVFIEAASNGEFMTYNEFVSLPLGRRHFLVAAEMNDIDAATKLLRAAAEKRLTVGEMMDLAYIGDVAGEAGENIASTGIVIEDIVLPVHTGNHTGSPDPMGTNLTSHLGESTNATNMEAPALTGAEEKVAGEIGIAKPEGAEGAHAAAPVIEGKAKAGRNNGKKLGQTVFTGKAVGKALAALIDAANAVDKVSAMGVELKVKNADRTRLSGMAEEAAGKLGKLSVALSAIKDRFLEDGHGAI